MTGYGRGTAAKDGRTLTVELRSVNHRFLDISLRMPHSLSFLEDAVRKIVSSRLKRGHIDVSLSYQNLRSDAKTVIADVALAKQYKEALVQLNEVLHLNPEMGIDLISSYSDVLTVSEAPEDEEALYALVSSALGTAIGQLTEMRKAEGGVLRAALLKILDEIEKSSYLIDERYPQTVKEYEVRLTARISELLNGNVDMSRIAQEVAIMADKAAIDEETVRLRSHIEQARKLCDADEPIGRSLDFLVQEMNREVNTISSKSQDIPITNAVLKCKSEIEKLREQLQNVE